MGCQPHREGRQPIIWPNFCRKLLENEGNWTKKGRHVRIGHHGIFIFCSEISGSEDGKPDDTERDRWFHPAAVQEEAVSCQ